MASYINMAKPFVSSELRFAAVGQLHDAPTHLQRSNALHVWRSNHFPTNLLHVVFSGFVIAFCSACTCCPIGTCVEAFDACISDRAAAPAHS